LELATNGTLDFFNARFLAGARFAHEFQDAIAEYVLIDASQSVAEERQRSRCAMAAESVALMKPFKETACSWANSHAKR
jgi:hypothetical protein